MSASGTGSIMSLSASLRVSFSPGIRTSNPPLALRPTTRPRKPSSVCTSLLCQSCAAEKEPMPRPAVLPPARCLDVWNLSVQAAMERSTDELNPEGTRLLRQVDFQKLVLHQLQGEGREEAWAWAIPAPRPAGW